MGDAPDDGVAALFTRLGDGLVQAQGSSRGPWSVHSLHGGPVAALLAGEAESVLGTGTPVSRLTIDLERPVPLDVLRVTSRLVRPGRKVQVGEVELHTEDGTRVARATALGVRRTPVELPDGTDGPIGPLGVPISPEAPPIDFRLDPDLRFFHADAMAWGGTARDDDGVVTSWTRLALPVIAGEVVSPLQRTAAAADFINGLSSRLAFGEWIFINPDLTITVHRAAAGEWIGLRAVTRLDASGVGTAEAEADLFDERGRIGHAVQNLLVEPIG
jgi:acyl-coenzyme A thioesterase PaaI-like protein